MYWGPLSLLVLLFSVALSLFVYKDEIKGQLNSIANLSQLLVWVFSLGYAIYQLRYLSDINHATPIIVLFLIFNLYAGMFNIVIKIYIKSKSKKHKKFRIKLQFPLLINREVTKELPLKPNSNK